MRLIGVALLLLSFQFVQAQDMTDKELVKIIANKAETLSGKAGNIQFTYKQRFMVLLSDSTYNRMRIITPIIEEEKLNPTFLHQALEANFFTALDVKYALSEEILWAIFVHPLKELSPEQVTDGIDQVFNAAETFGTTYSSTTVLVPEK